MQVFIENEAGSNQKNLYNEKTLEYQKTVTVSRDYPFPYGFILNTTSGDGDNLDCFILTDQKLAQGTIVECEPVGLMLQHEDGEKDPNILAVMLGATALIDDALKARLTDFVSHVFDHLPGKKVTAGAFLGKEQAEVLIEELKD